MYFVDREKINQTLVYMETILGHFAKMNNPQSLTEKLELERVGTVIIESILDAGNSMIDGFIMRDPGSYEDIIDILEDEKVITTTDAKSLKIIIDLRKQLVQEYIAVDHQTVFDTLTTNQQTLLQFPKSVKRYLVEELGPVSAFLPNEDE